ATDFLVTQKPVITNFFPRFGVSGTSVTIEGINFMGVTDVGFGGHRVGGLSTPAPNQIVVSVPGTATDSGSITVTNAFGVGTSTENFIITQAPIIDSFDPFIGG